MQDRMLGTLTWLYIADVLPSIHGTPSVERPWYDRFEAGNDWHWEIAWSGRRGPGLGPELVGLLGRDRVGLVAQAHLAECRRVARAVGDVGDPRVADRIKHTVERRQAGVEAPGVAHAPDVVDGVARVRVVVLPGLARRQVTLLRVGRAEERAHRRRHRGVVARVATEDAVVDRVEHDRLLHVRQEHAEARVRHRFRVAEPGGVQPHAHREAPQRVVVVVHRQADLLEIVDALSTPRSLAGRLDGGQQQGDQDRDDRDHDQELDQRECGSMSIHGQNSSNGIRIIRVN